GDAQAWKVNVVANGYHKLVSKLDNNKSWDLPDCDLEGDKTLQLADYAGTSCQLFKFNEIETITALHPEKIGETDAQLEIGIYPNPVTQGRFAVYIKSANNVPYQVSIISANGKCVFEQQGLQNGANYINAVL